MDIPAQLQYFISLATYFKFSQSRTHKCFDSIVCHHYHHYKFFVINIAVAARSDGCARGWCFIRLQRFTVRCDVNEDGGSLTVVGDGGKLVVVVLVLSLLRRRRATRRPSSNRTDPWLQTKRIPEWHMRTAVA